LKQPLKEESVEWLLAGEPWAVYRTLTDLLDKDDKEKPSKWITSLALRAMKRIYS